MHKSGIDGTVLLTAAIAVALALRSTPNPFDWITGIAGLTLLLVLLSFDGGSFRSVFQSLAYAAVCGLALVLIAGSVFQMVATNQDAHSVEMRLAATWLFGSVILWAIDRARMGSRVDIDLPAPNPRRTLISDLPTPAPTYTPAAFAPPAPPVYSPAQSPVPVHQPAPPMNPIAFAATVAPEPVAEPLPPIAAAPEIAMPPSPVPPGAIAIPPGREASVYVSLVGEGIACLRSVRAEHLGRDFYKIVEPMPDGETWEYQPGQVVRAKKKNLSSGKALVAFEEAPRAS